MAENLDKLLSEKEKYKTELTKNQIAILSMSMQTDIEEYQNVLDNYEKLDEKDIEISKEEIKNMIQERKIIIENLLNTHYPVFKMTIVN